MRHAGQRESGPRVSVLRHLLTKGSAEAHKSRDAGGDEGEAPHDTRCAQKHGRTNVYSVRAHSASLHHHVPKPARCKTLTCTHVSMSHGSMSHGSNSKRIMVYPNRKCFGDSAKPPRLIYTALACAYAYGNRISL